MVDSFDPQLGTVIDGVNPLAGSFLDPRTFTYKDVERILNARSDSQLINAIHRLPHSIPLFTRNEYYAESFLRHNERQADDLRLKELKAIQATLRLVLDCLCLSKKNDLAPEAIEKVGVSIIDGEEVHQLGQKIQSRIDQVARNLHDANDDAIRSFFSASTLSFTDKDDPFTGMFSFTIDAPYYSQWLLEAIRDLPEWSAGKLLEDVYSFDMRLQCFEKNPEGVRECLKSIVDGLFTLHLKDIRTISNNGGEEFRRSLSVISSIWWLALDELRTGRLGKCAACGRPFIAKKERGQKRVYCCDACRQWQKKHPGKHRR